MVECVYIKEAGNVVVTTSFYRFFVISPVQTKVSLDATDAIFVIFTPYKGFQISYSIQSFPMQNICNQCPAKFNVTDDDVIFYEKVSPVAYQDFLAITTPIVFSALAWRKLKPGIAQDITIFPQFGMTKPEGKTACCVLDNALYWTAVNAAC